MSAERRRCLVVCVLEEWMTRHEPRHSPKELPPDKRKGREATLPLESLVLGEIHVGHVMRCAGWEAGSLA